MLRMDPQRSCAQIEMLLDTDSFRLRSTLEALRNPKFGHLQGRSGWLLFRSMWFGRCKINKYQMSILMKAMR